MLNSIRSVALRFFYFEVVNKMSQTVVTRLRVSRQGQKKMLMSTASEIKNCARYSAFSIDQTTLNDFNIHVAESELLEAGFASGRIFGSAESAESPISLPITSQSASRSSQSFVPLVISVRSSPSPLISAAPTSLLTELTNSPVDPDQQSSLEQPVIIPPPPATTEPEDVVMEETDEASSARSDTPFAVSSADDAEIVDTEIVDTVIQRIYRRMTIRLRNLR